MSDTTAPQPTGNALIDLEHHAQPPAHKDFAIGCVGAGFIMRDVQVVAYQEAGLNVTAIASRTPENARAAAEARNIPKV